MHSNRQIPTWQDRLITRILLSMKKNYIFYDKKSDAAWREALEKEFAQHFAHLATEAAVLETFKSKFTQPPTALYFATDKSIITQKEVDALLGATQQDAIILTGDGESKNVYCVVNGKLIQDNLLFMEEKWKSFTTVKVNPEAIDKDAIINAALHEAALCAFAEQMTLRLHAITGDEHFSIGHYPGYLTAALNSHYFHEQKTFGPSSPLVSNIDSQVLERLLKPSNKLGIKSQPKEVDVQIPDNVGYLRLKEIFNPQHPDMLPYKEKLFNTLESMQGKDAIIIDLRNCPGGTPLGAQYLASFFFAEARLLCTYYTKDDSGILHEDELLTIPQAKLSPYNDGKVVNLANMPLYILVNEKTFSAAEEFAFDMQAAKRATLVGTRTHGGNHFSRGEPLLNAEGSAWETDYHIIIPRSYSSVTKGKINNWEDTPKLNGEPSGVMPDIKAPDKALSVTLNLIQVKAELKNVPVAYTKQPWPAMFKPASAEKDSNRQANDKINRP